MCVGASSVVVKAEERPAALVLLELALPREHDALMQTVQHGGDREWSVIKDGAFVLHQIVFFCDLTRRFD